MLGLGPPLILIVLLGAAAWVWRRMEVPCSMKLTRLLPLADVIVSRLVGRLC